MKFSYSWLLDHLDTKLSPSEIAETLTNIGLELESLTDYSSYAQFVVATIVDFKKHPNADRLNICTVENGQKTFQVICGAPNVKKGMKGIFAADGMYIPGTDITLKKGKIRGEVSEGMLLSERELKLSDNHEGIIEVHGDLPNGTDAVTALDLNDPIFEIGVTPNRGDCLSVRGIARDLTAKGVGTLKPLNIKKATSEKFESPISWSIQNDGNSCSFVVSRYYKDIKNSVSPEWLQKKLLSIGLRPINALVDITNFITMDLGRPLHVFDADKIGNQLNMRLSNDQEKLLALDNKEYLLNDTTTVIADDKNTLAIAGIIGGNDSGCTLETKNVFLEVAVFNPSMVAKTGRKLGINSDARYRFERGLDLEMVNEGLDYATSLIQDICGGSFSKKTHAGDLDLNKKTISYKSDTFEKVIGIELSKKDQVKILNNLFFETKENTDGICKVTIPSWRNDINKNIDLIEEIIRIHGYDKIKTNNPLSTSDEQKSITSSSINKKYTVIKKLKKSLISNHFDEIITFSFQSVQAHEILKGDPSLKISNSISEDHAFMRSSMLFNHLESLENNRKKGHNKLSVFEIGPIYNHSKSQENILFALTSNIKNQNKYYEEDNLDYYYLTKIVSKILGTVNFDIRQFNITRSESNIFHPGQSAELHMGKKIIARYGKIHPLILEDFPKLSNACGIELYFENLPIDSMFRRNKNFKQESNFQHSEKDFSFIFNIDQNLYEVYRFVLGIDKKLIQKLEFFDEYLSSEIGSDKKSITFKVTIQSLEKTLDEKDLEQIHQNIIDKVSNKFDANIRS
ncbi:phenylalanine--tRNA ligase, beta subunit [alpha proteobacterium HIMB59]|nr:phenylalanine--tRNA ligase, beta subunit [alpha proteobacterium HIMB59]